MWPSKLGYIYTTAHRPPHTYYSLIDFSDVNAEQIQALSDACSPATFGRNSEDVLDESYRKAAKPDTKFFATNLNPEKLGLLDVVRSQLLSGTDGQRSIHFELYKLNVYGQFKNRLIFHRKYIQLTDRPFHTCRKRLVLQGT